MKYSPIILSVGVLILGACSSTKQQKKTVENEPLTAKMTVKPIIRSADSLELSFTVYNRSTRTQKFCKWHTPFESKTLSKYLDIKDEQGTEAQYRGIMAKRIMPPPADSYIEVKPGDSLSAKVDIMKDYRIIKPGKYSIHYNAQEISGLLVKDSISFIYKN